MKRKSLKISDVAKNPDAYVSVLTMKAGNRCGPDRLNADGEFMNPMPFRDIESRYLKTQ